MSCATTQVAQGVEALKETEAPKKPCVSGNHYKDGSVSHFIECYSNGNKKRRKSFYSDGSKSSESTYWETGKQKTYTRWNNFGWKYSEDSYWETGKLKTSVDYESDGTPLTGFPRCYDKDGKPEQCTIEKHGCTRRRTPCLP